MVVQHNLTAMNANRYLGINNSKLSKSLEKLSSGYAINRAGDNAAGLAVSEKMRSQIAGMTQGVKNAQDGISMVQTFEGALTETHSILQRMKTLADQMANGSYDDAVDRTAAQQEFLQLNDELNQIADTDFNGVIVLNGGEMADGLKAVDGQFNYKNGNAATIEQAVSQPGDLATQLRDDADKAGMNVDDSDYGDKAANDLWKTLGITADSTDVNITFVRGTDADGNATWEIAAATASASTTKELTPASVANLTERDDAVATMKNANADTDTLKSVASANGFGSGTITISTTDGTAATLTGVDADGNAKTVTTTLAAIGMTATRGTGNWADATATFDFTTAESETSTINQDITAAAKKGLDVDAVLNADASGDGGFKVSWGENGEHVINSVTNTVDAKDGDYITINFKPSKVHAPTNIGVAEDNPITITPDAGNGSTLSKNDVDINVTLDSSVVSDDKMNQYLADALENLKGVTIEVDGTGAFTAVAGAAAGDIDIAADGTLSYHSGNATVAFGKIDIAIDGGVTGDKIEFGLKPSKYSFDSSDNLRATSVLTTGDQKALFEKNTTAADKVSTSNAFNNSEAILTYKDNITLQVGARTKDAVNFTFKYNSDAIGDLEADLNCTAKGLGTDKLNINSQSDANYAIDKIDQAINKVSLIRGTFGAIQNRLEHKIDNMNVSIENLTSAESQIRDTNMPQEMMNFTKQQILAQASQSMLAQANQLPQGVLSLLQ